MYIRTYHGAFVALDNNNNLIQVADPITQNAISIDPIENTFYGFDVAHVKDGITFMKESG
jgi:hypothetical protein